MRALVVGYGSIGARHAEVLRNQGCHVAVVSRRSVAVRPSYRTIAEALEACDPQYVVIANRTSEHMRSLEELAAARFRGTVLVEKPLFETFMPVPENEFAELFVGYNLRFHHGVQQLYRTLQGQRVLSVQAYVGQYLPTWRPGRDYRDTYSASRAAGGGVLRDLSHELDYLNWMFGGWTGVTALGGQLSDLQVDSEDTVAALVSFRFCPLATINLNYLDRLSRRHVLINTAEHTIELSMTEEFLQVDGEREMFATLPNDSYTAQHRAILDRNAAQACTSEQALEIVALIDAAERSLLKPHWITR